MGTSYIIFKEKVHIESWYKDLSLPRDWRIKTSPNGWTTDEIRSELRRLVVLGFFELFTVVYKFLPVNYSLN